MSIPQHFFEIKVLKILLNQPEIERYEKLIGKGKFGNVYFAINQQNGEHVAIKQEKSDLPYSSLKHEVKIMTYFVLF